VLRFLDRFRAGEALGEASLGAWIAVSDLACVKGGLRVVQQREGFHARLLAERIKELGGSPRYEIPDAVYEASMRDAGNADKPDAQKVLEFVKRFPDIDEALRPIHEMADRLDDDPETQSLLRTIAQDECSTLTFFANTCQQLNG
jgi:DNA-binding ferritin-like protein